MTNIKSKNIPKILNGTIKRHPDGFGFFIPDDKELPDVFIPAHSMKTAMTNDKVTVVTEKERDGRFRGDITQITERAQKKIAGAFTLLNDKYGMIKDEGKGWGKDLKIPLDKSLKAQPGELVAAQITNYPDKGDFTGEVTEIIGDIENALNDIKRVVITQGIPEHFAPETLEEAKKLKANPDEADFKNRKDLRSINLITIDGATAKDFDDAVYVEMNPKGFHLIVAIADVSHYVKPQTSMDRDAYERGTSVYFPNFVIPMLPEGLSNGLCSLNPRVPRLALVADMHFDFTGEMTQSSFYEAVIESKARVTYGEAQEIIDDPEAQTPIHQKFTHVKDNILKCADLAKVLMAKRFKEGSLDLEVPETELLIDGAGEPIDVVKSERLFAHRLIEEMMLAANVAVAKFLASKDIPAIYRTHEPPDPLKISMLEKFLKSFGSKVNLSGEKLQKKLTRALHEFTNEVQAQVIHILTLRSMSQAKYTLDNIGHFGLGFDFYTHFTSPIRRYPDLIVHRLIKNAIGLSQYRLMPEDDIQTAGTWLSACEQRSAKAERQIQAIKKARFMKKLVGESFEGIISSVTKFGVFVLLRQYNIDGLVRLEDLGKDSWEYDEENLRLVAKRSGQSYNLGDPVQVTVDAIDIEQGQINFVLEGQEKQSSKQNKNSYSKNNEFDKRSKNSNKNDRKPQKAKSFSNDKKDKSFKKDFSEKSQPSSSKKQTGDSYTPQPRYSSLSDYLDQMSKKKSSSTSDNLKKGNSSYGSKTSNNKKLKHKEKSGSKFSSDREDSQKRNKTSNDSFGVRKTRSTKSSRKTKSR
ncbi:MAG: ribonuclease R [Pseudobdellovibrio sp.]